MFVGRPVEEALEAVVDPKQLSHYFTTGSAVGRLEAGRTVTWDFHGFPGAFPVRVCETTVTFTFEPTDDGRTRVEIAESGWHETPSALKAAYGNCMVWSQMLGALKAWLEHGINLRVGAYK